LPLDKVLKIVYNLLIIKKQRRFEMNEFLRDLASDQLFLEADEWQERQELLQELAREQAEREG